MRQNSPGQDDPGARTWQCPLPTADLLASASFSVFSINTSWSMCERSCLLSNSSGYVQDEANVLVLMMCEEVKWFCSFRLRVLLAHLQSNGPRPCARVHRRAEVGRTAGSPQLCISSDGNKVQKQVILCRHLKMDCLYRADDVKARVL